jgi:hypothetical protein
MTAFAATLAEVMQLVAGIGAATFALAMVLAAAQTQAAATTGRPALLADWLERALPLVISIAVVATAQHLGAELQALLAGGASSAGEAVALWRALAGAVTTVTITCAGAGLAAGLALGAFSAQLAALSGETGALSELWRRGLAVAGAAALTALSLAVANAVLALVFGAA